MKQKKYYLKCTYEDKGIFPYEKTVTFPVTRPVRDPLMRGDALSFRYFVQECNMEIMDSANALVRVEPISVHGNEALVSFSVTNDLCRCYVRLDDIVEKEVSK